MSSLSPIPELVAPAGNAAKLRAALHFGADAVYVGMKRHSLRAHAGNFDDDELKWAIDYAHDRGKRLYVAVNVQPFDEELSDIEDALRRLVRLHPDGVVVGDAGVLRLARRVAPALRLHLSTQASVINREALADWNERGVERIVLARELSLERLTALARRSPTELEVFAHGAMCVATSGRCFLSLYWVGEQRDPRHGTCAQPCRWPYLDRTIAEARFPDREHHLEQDERGTYFFDSRDLCALPLLDRLAKSGVRALKIEGRTRSVHYVGTVVDVYREALDILATGDESAWRARLPALTAELGRSSKRGFSTHFLGGSENSGDTYLPDGGSPGAGEAVLVGTVRAADEDVELELCNPLERGARLEFRDRGLRCERASVHELRDRDGTVLSCGRPGDVVRLPLRLGIGPGALARRATKVGTEGPARP